MDFSVLLNPVYKPTELIELARLIDEWGFKALWLPDEKFFRDCYVSLALVASHTNHINLGPCVTDPYSRHPIMTAAAIGSLAEVAPGRTWLGLGAGGRGFHAMGLLQDRPAIALREAITVIRSLLSGNSVDFHGKVIHLNDRPLDFLPQPVPILIGTGFGHSIQELAGEQADAVMLANYASPAPIQSALKRVLAGAKRAGRSQKDFRLISRIDIAIHHNRAEAKSAVSPAILSALRASYPALTYLEDLPEFDLSSKLLDVLRRKDYQSRSHYSLPAHSSYLIPDALAKHMSVAGSREDVSNQLAEIFALGIFNEIAFHLIPCEGQNILEALTLLKGVITSANS